MIQRGRNEYKEIATDSYLVQQLLASCEPAIGVTS